MEENAYHSFFPGLISRIFHPVFLPTLTALFMLNHPAFSLFSVSTALSNLVLAVIFLNTCLLPVLISFLMKRFGIISSLQMEERKERNAPFFFSLVLYYFTYQLIRKAPLPPAIDQMLAGACISLGILFIVNFRYKLSAHMTGIGGVCGAFTIYGIAFGQDVLIPVIVAYLMAGLTGTARLMMKAHDPYQVYYGFLTGIAGQSITSWL